MHVQEMIDGYNPFGEHLIKRETSYRPVSLRLCATTTLRWLLFSDMFILRINLNILKEYVDCINMWVVKGSSPTIEWCQSLNVSRKNLGLPAGKR